MAAHRCAVLGSPIAHSLSPVLHRAAYEALGLTDWSYDAHRVEADELAGFVAGLGPEWVGLSLTMPLKEAVLELAQPTPVAALVGAGNTLVLDHGTGPHRVDNTDVSGMTAALAAAGVVDVGSALLVGAGATARSALAALAPFGTRRVTVMARSAERAHASLDPIAERLGIDLTVVGWGQVPADRHDVTVATVPAELAPQLAAGVAAVSPVLFDVTYDPWPTALADAALAAGVTVLDGLDLLAHQAVDQVRLFTGRQVEATVLLSAARSVVAARRDR